MAEGFLEDDMWEKLIAGSPNFKYNVSRSGPYQAHSENFLGRWILTGFQPIDNIATRYKSCFITIQKAQKLLKQTRLQIN